MWFSQENKSPHGPGPGLRRISLGFWISVLILSALWLGCERLGALRTLETVGQIQACSPERLQSGLPVALKGTLVRYDERQRLLVIQDETGGIPVQVKSPSLGLSQGDRVSIHGFTAFESFNPVIVKPRLERLGSGTLPIPVPGNASLLFSGKQDFRLVELEGDVLDARSAGASYFEMDVRVWDRVIRVSGDFLHKTPIYLLSNHRIRFRGVPVTTYFPSGEVYGLIISLHDDEDITFTDPVASNRSASNSLEEIADPKMSTLTAVWDIKSLTNRDAMKHYPVLLKGIVTTYDVARRSLVLEDATGGIYIHPPEEPMPELRPGAQVEIDGCTTAGAFAPVVRIHKIRMLGMGSLPVPLIIKPSDGFRGVEENRWAEVEGIVRQVEPSRPGEFGLLMVCGQVQLKVDIQHPATAAEMEALVDHRVKVQGVYEPLWTADQRFLGTKISTPSLDYIKPFSEATGDTFSSRVRPIHSLLEYSPQGVPQHRVKVAGRITHADSNGTIYLADASGGIRVDCVGEPRLHVGDGVEVLGFLDWSRAKVALTSAVFQEVQGQPEIPVLSVAADSAMSGVNDGRLVQVEGFLREQATSFGDRILSLESGRTTFTAVMEHPQAFPGQERLRSGALVRLTGICDVAWNEDLTPPAPAELHLRLRSPQDIVVLKSGPFWTLKRVMFLMAILLIVLAATTVVLILLQKRIKARTEQLKHQMAEREALEDQLRQAQKLEGVGRLAGGVAHDFNNLLTVINGYCEMLVGELQQEDLKICAREIHKAGERAASLTKQLLAFSRKQILQPVVVDLNRLVLEMEKMLGRLITEDIELVTRLSPEPCLIKADPGQIGQVLMNLVVNARDAMPDGGQLIIETDPVVLDKDIVRTRPFVQAGPHIRLTVTDTGHGMDAATLEKIFEPFFTTKEQGKGTGLGLSTVFGIIKQSGGHIWVYSELGQGTSFKLFLPQVEGERISEAESPEEKTHGGGEVVLVVEDQEEVRKLVCRALEGQGYHILHASDGPEALEVARRHPGTIHLLVTDVVMPGMNGRDLARRLTEVRQGLKVLFMSGYTEDAVVHRGVLDKGIDFIQKPFSPRELAAIVAEILHRR